MRAGGTRRCVDHVPYDLSRADHLLPNRQSGDTDTFGRASGNGHWPHDGRFRRGDGSTVGGNFFIHFLGVVHNSGWLKKTQIIQRDYNTILIKMVTAPPPPYGTLEEIRGSLHRVLGLTCQVEFEFVEAIPPLPSGKYRYTVSPRDMRLAYFGKGNTVMRMTLAKNHKITFVELICWVIRWSGACYVLRKCLWRYRALILIYHNPKPTVIDAHLHYLKRVSKIVSMPELWSSFSTSPLSVITIDDGMVGNLELKEVFIRHDVRPMIYLCTGIVCSESGYWWLSLGSDQQVENLKNLDNKVRKKLLREMGFEQAQKNTPRQAVSMEELPSMLNWADLGAHTRFHPILTRCEDQECEEEISLSRKELLPFIGIELNYFAYPNGDYSDREVDFVRRAGFSAARTCDPGWNCPNSDRFRLKAIYVADEASVDKFAVQLTGVPALARSFFAKVRGPLTRTKSVVS